MPLEYAQVLDLSHFKRSLATKDYVTAKRRCSEAVRWFQETVERMARSGMLDRDALEEAANAYFAQLVREVDQPRDLPSNDYDNALAFQIERAEEEIERQNDHLTAHSYSDGDRNAARAMLRPMGVDFDELVPDGQLAALNHVVRAKRQQMRFLLHSLQTPASRFTSDDELFASRLAPAVRMEAMALSAPASKVVRCVSACKWCPPDSVIGA